MVSGSSRATGQARGLVRTRGYVLPTAAAAADSGAAEHAVQAIPYLVGVQLHQVFCDQVVQLSRNLNAGGPPAHNHKGQQLLALLQVNGYRGIVKFVSDALRGCRV